MADHAYDGEVVLCRVQDTTLSVDQVIDAVRTHAAGGVVVFLGMVRDHDEGRTVARLGYTAHPRAEAELLRVATSVTARFPVLRTAVVHRTGDLAIGDLAVVLAVSAVHRGDAFEAARALIDELKETVPIWKEQDFTDGTTEWVGTP